MLVVSGWAGIHGKSCGPQVFPGGSGPQSQVRPQTAEQYHFVSLHLLEFLEGDLCKEAGE